ncbi:hypothetical protein BGZ60DRAFT_524228 [Tricladium varicosporioides]|nr:hypothetical protein BGZ60DRAFT_524228 [Hymenoscyphus varicosporioides]
MAQFERNKPVVLFFTGETGVGKSTFIRYATGLDVKSGFGDTYQNDASILAAVDCCLADAFQDSVELAGVLFLHSLVEARMKNGAMKNLVMFKKMVGPENLYKCRLITTKWSLQDRAVSEQREGELQNNPNFWKPLIDRGARMVRFGDSMDSAKEIIRPLLEGPGVVLQLTQETQIKGLKLEATDAGKEVNEDLQKAKDAHRQELADLAGMHEMAMVEKDQELAMEIKKQEARIEEELRQLEEERKVLREGQKSTGGFWGWVARGVALSVGITAAILSEGALAGAAIALVGNVEAVIQRMK